MARFHDVLGPHGYLAIVEEARKPLPWDDQLGFIGEYSLNKDFEPYSTLTMTDELERRLFERKGIETTGFVPFAQSVDDYVESFHARYGLSRDRMRRSGDLGRPPGGTTARSRAAMAAGSGCPHAG